MSNTILKQVNAIGEKLGYPFYVYPNGTCGKSMVSPDGKTNAAVLVQRGFLSDELKADALDNDACVDNALGVCLNELGNNLGFPFYVYVDGTCGFTPEASMLTGTFALEVRRTMTSRYLKFDEAKSAVAKKPVATASAGISSLQLNEAQAELLKRARNLVARGRFLQGEEERAFFQFASNDELDVYFSNRLFCDTFQKEYILRGDKRVLLTLMRHEKISEENQLLMAQYCEDNVVLALAGREHVSSKLVPKLQELGRHELVQAVLKEQDEGQRRAELEYRFW